MEPSTSAGQALFEEAARRGVSVEYYDIFGTHHQIKPEVLIRILESIGLEPKMEPLPETLVITQGEERDLPEPATLVLETGEQRTVQRLDETIPLGYHDLHLAGTTTRLIVCPDRMWQPPEKRRCAGIAISLYGLRSSRNWGAGDLRDLQDFINWSLDAIGAQFIALNPLHAIHNRSPYNASPYLPLCSYYRNYLYLDIESIEEFSTPEILDEFNQAATQKEISALRESEYVEYEQVSALKLRFLRLCFDQYLKASHGNFREYVDQQGQLLADFALYCALDKYFHETIPDTWIWTQWPQAYRTPHSSECETFRRDHPNEILFYCWLQWQLDRQLAKVQAHAVDKGMKIGLYHDLALATDRFGCDLWANRLHFIEGCRVGAPPDDFSPEGQDWAFPPMNGAAHLRDGYRLYIASIRHNATHGGALRLDHVMRLFRLYWIPDGFGAKDGTYVYERWRDLFGIMALESHRLKVRIIGEDLGTITDEMREGLEQYGVLGYRLLYFERENDGTFRNSEQYHPNAVATTSTHDLPTLAGFWLGQDIEARRKAGLLPDEGSYTRQWEDRKRDKQRLLDRLHQSSLLPDKFPSDAAVIENVTVEMQTAILAMLSSTPCELLVMNHEDLTFETLQQNLPGSTAQYPNWRRKMKYTLEELRTRQELSELYSRVRAFLTQTGRKS